MEPGKDYDFPGADYVKEIPLKWAKLKKHLKKLK
jgi:hypothetical protein